MAYREDFQNLTPRTVNFAILTISFIIINHHYQNLIITNITVIIYYSCFIHDHYKLSKHVLDKKDKRKKLLFKCNDK